MSASRVVPGIAIRIGSGSTPSTTTSVGPVTTTTTTTTAPIYSTSAPSAPAHPTVVDANDQADNLFGIYMQATKGTVRQQWIILPPPVAALGVKGIDSGPVPTLTYLNRTQQHEGNRSKWFHMRQWETSEPLDRHFKSLLDDGWALIDPVVVPIELDDYLKVWNNRETPHKYIRAIDKVLKPMGLSTK